jgi:thiamine transport system ATP-binding protein
MTGVTPAPTLDVDGATVRFDDRVVLDRFSLTVTGSETVGLLGPSGSGKSTLLRVIAGLHTPEAGTVSFDGEDLAGVPTHRRRFGYVFQDHQLFEHLDVFGNIAFGLRMAKVPAKLQRDRVAELLDLVSLPGFEHRRVGTLSGGESQRVALARALAPEPRLLLLDEPLSALDRDLHDRLAADLRDLLAHIAIPAIHVTHDRDEAAQICTRIIHLG